MRTSTSVLALIFAIAAGAIVFAPEIEIETSRDLSASPAEAYAVLVDGAAYPDWNPFVTRFAGDVRAGATLDITVAPAAGATMSFTPEVLAAVPGRELRWRGSAPVPGLFEGEHYFLLEPTETGARLIHGERFSGAALWFIDVEAFRGDFERMNAALAERLTALKRRAATGAAAVGALCAPLCHRSSSIWRSPPVSSSSLS